MQPCLDWPHPGGSSKAAAGRRRTPGCRGLPPGGSPPLRPAHWPRPAFGTRCVADKASAAAARLRPLLSPACSTIARELVLVDRLAAAGGFAPRGSAYWQLDGLLNWLQAAPHSLATGRATWTSSLCGDTCLIFSSLPLLWSGPGSGLLSTGLDQSWPNVPWRGLRLAAVLFVTQMRGGGGGHGVATTSLSSGLHQPRIL